jgi:hypothetical protein
MQEKYLEISPVEKLCIICGVRAWYSLSFLLLPALRLGRIPPRVSAARKTRRLSRYCDAGARCHNFVPETPDKHSPAGIGGVSTAFPQQWKLRQG